MRTGVKAAAGPNPAAQQALRDAMRKLWEDHVTWTRLAIVTFADGAPGFGRHRRRLCRTRSTSVTPSSPSTATRPATQLTALLHDHITIAVEVLRAAKAGDSEAFADAKAAGTPTPTPSRTSSRGQPAVWPQAKMRAEMRTHLDQTLAEAAHELAGDYARVADYDEIHEHILENG